MSKSVDVILGAVKAAGEAALRLHEENKALAAQLANAREGALELYHIAAADFTRAQNAERERDALRELLRDSYQYVLDRCDEALADRIDAAMERRP